jgi:multiple RNA-binding domain-containing protein 1
VEFVEPSEARLAHKSLAYRKYKNSPLFFEWAPIGLIDKSLASNKESSSAAQKQEVQSSEAPVEDNLEEFSSLFVKNLNFSSDENALREHALRLGVQGLRAVVIQKKAKGSALLSQGYGFLEFQSSRCAEDALRRLNQSVLDSHLLEVKPSERRLTQPPTSARINELKSATQRSTKIVVRNVAFQASKSDIRSLFSSFGAVKSVRIPKQMNGKHRGFAFVDFLTEQEAANAMAALKNAHLYGRHLVLEWAKGDEIEEEVTESRKRAGEDHAKLEGAKKRNKAALEEEAGSDEEWS